ncbi:complex I intermediate-associated protein 84, mitochondrial [Podospora conica]|nr:complex I intermediate-associated protein 84, mitochondrial [Schizothecium conicum]
MPTPSHLTRRVYRRLLAGHGLLRPCPAVSSRFFTQCRPRPPSLLPVRHTPQQRRSFLGIFAKPPREVKEPVLEPGYESLLQFRSLENENLRIPPRDQLVNAFRKFVYFKWQNKDEMNSTQAFLVYRVLLHLLDPKTYEGEGAGVYDDIAVEDLTTTLEVINVVPKGKTDNHLELARLVFKELEWRKDHTPESVHEQQYPLGLFLKSLTLYGASVEAAQRFDDLCKAWGGGSVSGPEALMWDSVIVGLAAEGKEEELLQFLDKAEAAELPRTPAAHAAVVQLYARLDNLEETERWFKKPITIKQRKRTMHYSVYQSLTELYLRTGRPKWIETIFENLLESHPKFARGWDPILQWCAAAQDRDVEYVKHLLDKMQNGGDDRPPVQVDSRQRPPAQVQVDSRHILSLVEGAMMKKNPLQAERFFALHDELNIPVEGITYITQMECRLDAGDLSGAHDIFLKLQNHEGDLQPNEDLPVLNKYLRILCEAPTPDLDRILDVTASVELRHARLEPSTVIALSLVFLHADKQFDVIDTLSLHTVSYSLDDRSLVRSALVEYILSPKLSTARAWDAYSLLRQFFPETEPHHRVRLMDAFFARRRPDMACYVFGHMRGHPNAAQRPTADVYVRCLEGLGRAPDDDSVRMVHNMLKMDTTVEVDTRLRNALMLAYGACGFHDVALQFWREIIASAEGPTYNSLAIVLWVCEGRQERDDAAKEIWQRVLRLDLDVPADVVLSYCGALAGRGQLEDVKRWIGVMEKETGHPPTWMTLGVVYNALPAAHKGPFGEWAKQEYPDLWEKLGRRRQRNTMTGPKFDIVRHFEA